jgi:hypothetical protein
MTPRRFLPILLAAALTSSPASAFIASNGLQVLADGPQTFYVRYQGNSAPTAFWCAASDYAMSVLRAPRSTRIYRLSEPPRRGGDGVRFSLSSEGAASSTGLVVFGNVGASITISLAQTYCRGLADNRRGS